jgi:hypothetical protein
MSQIEDLFLATSERVRLMEWRVDKGGPLGGLSHSQAINEDHPEMIALLPRGAVFLGVILQQWG